MNWRDVPVPDRMKSLDRDSRGLPIPFVVFRSADGTPHFTVNDMLRRNQCIDEDLCGICGQLLFRGRWFLGGPACAFHPAGAYLDPPMHKECLDYAAQVCPFLANTRYNGSLEDATIRQLEGTADAVLVVDQQAEKERPLIFVAVMAIGHRMTPGKRYFRPNRPYRHVEFWRHGRRLENIDELPEELRSRLPPAAV